MEAPSFSSFPDLEVAEDANRIQKAAKRSDKRREKSGQDKRRSDRKRAGPSRSSQHSEPYEQLEPSVAELFIEEALRDIQVPENSHQVPPVAVKGLFLEDRRGDEGNLRFGTLTSVSKYSRFGRGEVLGFPNEWKLVRNSKSEVLPRGKVQNSRYTSNKAVSSITSPLARKLVIRLDRSTGKTEDQESGFVPLAAQSDKNRRDHTDPSYSIEETPNDDNAADSDSASAQSDVDEEVDTVPVNAMSQITSQLEAEVLSHPTLAIAWLDLLEHLASSSPTLEAKAQLALSVLERAFKTSASNKRNVALWRVMLPCGALVWPPERMETEWENALQATKAQDLSQRSSLLSDYMTYKLGNGGVEGLEEAMRIIRTDLRRLPNSLELNRVQLRLMWRAISGLIALGYTERGIAVLQAQTEMISFAPNLTFSLAFSDKLRRLEEFWESEDPRIGDPGAQGWRSSHLQSHPLPSGDSGSAIQDSKGGSQDPYCRWSSRETRSDEVDVFPRKTSEMVDDPYATVLFSDIQTFLYDPLPTLTSREQGELIALQTYSIVHNIGLPLLGLAEFLGHVWDTSWADNRFSSTLAHTSPLLTIFDRKPERDWESFAGSIVAKVAPPPAAWGLCKSWTWGTRAPLEGYDEQGNGRMWEPSDIERLNSSKLESIRRIFHLISPRLQLIEFDQYWIAFEAAINVKQAVKVSRELLSKYRDSLPRWSTHARLERIRNKPADARKIYTTSLTGLLASSDQPGVAQMFWEWAEMEWLRGDDDAARQVILRSTGVGEGPTAVLKCKRVLEQTLQSRQTLALSNLLALLDVLSSSDISLAMSRFDLAPDTETTWMASTLFLYHYTHTRHAAIPPSVLRAHTEEATRRFPSNSVILGCYLEAERGETVWGRVRSTLAQYTLKPSLDGIEVSRAMWGVWREVQLREVERARGILGKTCNGLRSRQSIMVWKVAIDLECTTGNLRAAKTLLYRALAECPYAKHLYMLAFTPPLRTEFTISELETLANTMMERGIRIREDIEPYVEEARRGAEVIERSDDGDDEANEMEVIANEQRRLAPY